MLDRESLGSGGSHIDAVWQKIMKEVERGWLLGPLQKCEVPGDQPQAKDLGCSKSEKNQAD